jgi:hypothetical protein
MHFASLTAISMMLGLMRWPSIHWELAKAYAIGVPEQRAVFDAIFSDSTATSETTSAESGDSPPRQHVSVAEVNNYLPPAFMIVFGVSLLRLRTNPKIAIPASVASEIARPTTND